MKQFASLIGAILLVQPVWADGPGDNLPDQVRQIPPPGIELAPEQRQPLEQGARELGARIEALRQKGNARMQRYLPDVEVFHRAVDQALTFNEMYSPADVNRAQQLLEEGTRRAQALEAGDLYWTRQTGLVVRGFRSRLDDTVQPYGLVVPESYQPGSAHQHRCDIWFHGRGETSLELQFIAQRMTQRGQYAPEDTFVLHPFGRYSNAFKFAGEVDTLEALVHAAENYPLDEDRLAVRGFSMGGAACWHFAAHYADRWFAANPGAGFSETPLFLKTFQGEDLNPPWWEEKLWQLYDAPPWVQNFKMVPTIAYSGEIDRQKQAADVMAAAFEQAGMKLVHIIGPQTAHRIEPGAAREIEWRMTQLARQGRQTGQRAQYFSTCTLKYNTMGWLHVHGLKEHWTMAHAALIASESGPRQTISLRVHGITDLSVECPPGTFSPPVGNWTVELLDWNDPYRKLLEVPQVPVLSDGSLSVRLHQRGDRWRMGTPYWEYVLHKRHGLQGPIDDAFMDSFLFVSPTGTAQHEMVAKWVASELERAKAHWRQQMRGDVRLKTDQEVTEEDIARHNLILWGDPASNTLIAKVLPHLPLTWSQETLQIGGHSFDATRHAPVLIYPNPLNSQRYVVLNSSFTYREFDYLNNARQTPKLPDWAVIDLTTPPHSRGPGKVAAADFFDELWQAKPRP